MAEIVQSLFGLTPEMYQQQQQDQAGERALRFAQLTPIQQASYSIGRGAYGLAGAIGGALGGTDPKLQQITTRQQIAGQIDYNDPESMRRGITALSQANDPQGAMQLQQIFLSQEKIKAETTKALRERSAADPIQQILRSGQYTPASVFEYQQSGDISKLQPMDKGKDDIAVVNNKLVDKRTGRVIYEGDTPEKYSAHARELIDAGLKPGTEPFQRRMLEHIESKVTGAAKGSGTTVNLGGINISPKAVSEAAGKVVGAAVGNIENQYSLSTAVGDARKILDKGIYGGAYGPEKQFVAKFTGVGNPTKVVNTEIFMANIGEIVIPRLQQFGGNDSNEELKYLQKVSAGDLRLEPEAMKGILISAEKKIQNNIARLKAQVESVGTGATPPIGPMPPQNKPTQRFNTTTGKLEPIGG